MPIPFNFYPPQEVRQELTLARAGDTASGTNADAVITLPPSIDGAWTITEGVAFSYGGSGTLAGGRLSISVGGSVVFDVDVAAKGQGYFPFRRSFDVNAAVTITLAAGGANVVGKVTLLGGLLTRSGLPAAAFGMLDFADAYQGGHVAAVL